MGQEKHVFGYKDALSANDYPVGSTIKARVISFSGRKPYKNFQDEDDVAGFYMVTHDGREQELKLNDTNESDLRKLFNIVDYPQIVGKILTLKSKYYKLGNGWVVVGLDSAEQSEPKKVPGKL